MDKKIKSTIESLLFIAARPLTLKELAGATQVSAGEVENVLEELIYEYGEREAGVRIIRVGSKFQMITDPKNFPVVQKFLKTEVNRELTPASLETLAIIAYRGPIARSQLEQIRGVNCLIILRHLSIKGLIEEASPVEQAETTPEDMFYQVSLDFLRHLGIGDLKELPEWSRLNREIPLSSFTEKENENSEPL